jgi:glycosyltransferase involved in cell wall biosynthesis
MSWEENEISIHSNGGTEITKRSLQASLDTDLLQHFQIIPSRVRELSEDKIRILHFHDMPEEPDMKQLQDENYRNKFHKFVFSSNWQMEKFIMAHGMPLDEKMIVLETPIHPFTKHKKPNDSYVVNLVYFSTPQRGLEILVPVFEELSKGYTNIRLHVHSSFKIYGWDDLDAKFEPLYERIRQHPQMTYHGNTSQEELRKALENYHILAYPNIWPETSCRVLMESMSAGLLCIHPNFGALPDTSGGITSMYQMFADHNKHANMFYQCLEHAIKVVHQDEIQNYLGFVKAYADNRFQIDKVKLQWESTMRDLLQRYPDKTSRAIPGKQFIYRTS